VRSGRPGAVHSHPGGRRGVRFAPVRSVIVSARLAAVAAAAVLALSACGGGDPEEPGGTLPPVTPTPSASATAAEVPPASQEATPEGVEEFARYFVTERFAAYRSLDPERVRRLSTPDCEACTNFANSVQAIRDAKAVIAPSYVVEVLDVVSPGPDEGGQTATATVILRVGEFVVTAPDGSELARESAEEQLVQDLSLVRVGDGWLVQAIENV
jgi:hypothetical protein